MKLEHYLSTPLTYGEIVKNYLKVLQENKPYPAWTLNDNLEVIECKGLIKNNGSYNYHNNYDDSENELYIIDRSTKLKKWFSLNKEEVVKVQRENIAKWRECLEAELLRLESIA